MKDKDATPSLRRAIALATRMAADFLMDEQILPLHDEWAQAWLVGRAGEINLFVEHVLRRWERGRLEELAAAAMLVDYLSSLEVGYALHVGRDPRRRRITDVRTVAMLEEATLQRDPDALLRCLGARPRDI